METVRADSLMLESREAVFVHDASGATTELCAVVRRDRLNPPAAEEALRMHSEARAAGRTTRLMANPRCERFFRYGLRKGYLLRLISGWSFEAMYNTAHCIINAFDAGRYILRQICVHGFQSINQIVFNG